MVTPVFVRDEVASSVFTVDLSADLAGGETVTTVTLLSTSPTTTPPAIAPVSLISTSSFQISSSGGVDQTSYGHRYSVTTSLRTFPVVAAVQVLANTNVPYFSSNPYGFADLIGEILPGEAAVGKALFVLPPGTTLSNAYVSWEILDREGRVLSYGNCYTVDLTVDTFTTIVRGEGVVNLPSFASPTLSGAGYQLRWALNADDFATQYSYESIKVPERETTPIGCQDIVELRGQNISASLVTSRAYDTVQYEVFSGNTTLIAATTVLNPTRVSSGWLYQATVATNSLAGSLDPYQISWKYFNSSAPSQTYRESAKIFLLTPSILNAIDDSRTQVMKARTTLLGFDDAIFDVATIVTWLRRGKDHFNAAAGILTNFDMTDATGAIRELWLRCSEVSMLRSQGLAEGEKAFDFQGQAISLNVDKTQYYSALADALQSALDNDLPPLKKNLKISGITGGTGNLTTFTGGFRAKVGIAATPASPYARPTFWR